MGDLGLNLSLFTNMTRATPNCRFLIDNVETVWSYPSSKLLDFTHQCNIVGGITGQNALYDQALANLKPGGLYEAQEFDVGFNLETGLSLRTRL